MEIQKESTIEKDEIEESNQMLIDLKFKIEQQIESISRSNFSLTSNTNFIKFQRQYTSNIASEGVLFISKQTELLKQINCTLLQSCSHNWFCNDTDDILTDKSHTYCSKCFIYKS